MNFSLSSASQNILQLMRSLGYSPQDKKDSYVRRLSRSPYPHFHIYAQPSRRGVSISLHLDQKGACYRGQTAHSGEYEGQLVLEEKQRILKTLDLDNII